MERRVVICADLQHWLDEGMPREAETAARAHAERCSACAASLGAAREIEGLLSLETPPAPAGFADRVMARVETASQIGAAGGWRPTLPATPWWVQIAADPVTVMALVLLALVAWQIGWLGATARVFASGALQSRVYDAIAMAAVRVGLDAPAVHLGLWLCLIPALSWGSFVLYRWTERLLSPRPRA